MEKFNSLLAGFTAVLQLMQMMHDLGSLPSPSLHRFCSVSALLLTQLLGAVSLKDFTFLADNDRWALEEDRRDEELQELQTELGRWPRMIASWMSESPMSSSSAAERVLQGAISSFGRVLVDFPQKSIESLTFALCEVPPLLISINEEKATVALERQQHAATGGSSEDADIWLMPDD